MKSNLTIAAAVLAAIVGTALPLHADGRSQLLAAAGLTPAEAAGMSLNEIYAHKINREASHENKVTVSGREISGFAAGSHRQLTAAAGLSPADAWNMSLAEVAAYKANRNAGHDDRIPLPRTTSGEFDASRHPQLAAAAGVDPEEARTMSLNELYRLKVNRESSGDERQGY